MVDGTNGGSITHLVLQIPIGLVPTSNHANSLHMIVDIQFPREYSVNDVITLELAIVPHASADDTVNRSDMSAQAW